MTALVGTRWVFWAATFLFLASCTGETGPAGPIGPTGPEGPDGNTSPDIQARLQGPGWDCLDCPSQAWVEVQGADGVAAVAVNGIAVYRSTSSNDYYGSLPIRSGEQVHLQVMYFKDAESVLAEATVVIPGDFTVVGIHGPYDAITLQYGEDNTVHWGSSDDSDFYDVHCWVDIRFMNGDHLERKISNWHMQTPDEFVNIPASALWPDPANVDQVTYANGQFSVTAVSGPRDGQPGNIAGDGKGSFRAYTFGRGGSTLEFSGIPPLR